MKVAFLAAAVLAATGVVSCFATPIDAAKTSGPKPAARDVFALKALPLFFEPNQGQSAAQVKFLARGAGYGLFLTANETVLQLQSSALSSQDPSSLVIRMRLDGANASARVSGASLLPGKSSYFIGDDASKWRRDIPHFARVQYQAVYPGVDLIYYGNQGQLEYDFRVAPGADPNRIALSYDGATAQIDPAGSGDLLLSTGSGEVRFHAPRVYQPGQPAAPGSGNSSANTEKAVAGQFRQLAGNKIGFLIADYDHSRELVIDPVLSYSTYLGEGGESLVKIAVDSAGLIYVAGSTTSADFPLPLSPPAAPPLQNTLGGSGAQNLFIAKINPAPQTDQPELIYATYLGGSGTDSLAGLAIDSSFNIYVAGSTTSTNFPTTSNAFQQRPQVGSHGFVSAITLGLNSDYDLTYSTYLAGNGADTVTGLAVDNSCNTQLLQGTLQAFCNIYVTGNTTSSNDSSAGFPANANGYQLLSNSPGNPQFFATKIYTANTGYQSMLYSTYFGGGNPSPAIAIGGGIAVDPTGSSVNMYITGTTNMLGQAASGEVAFPLFNAQQTCLNEASETNCTAQTPTATTDAFAAKINPNEEGLQSLVYSTYLGGSSNDNGIAIAVDSSSNAYVTGSTFSDDWVSTGVTGYQTFYGGAGDAFIAKIGNLVGSNYPLTYFSYLGGTGYDVGQAIQVDSVQAIHLVGTTFSPNPTFPVTINTFQPNYGGSGDAFVASISTSLSAVGVGDFVSYLGGSNLDQGTGVAIDVFGATYAAGTTQSSNFPITPATAYQATLKGTQDAFVSKIGASSTLVVSVPNTSPTPNPVAAGTQVEFIFDITNTNPNGTDPASLVVFNALGVPTTGLSSTPTAKIDSGSGSCGAIEGSTISCSIPNLAVNATATVEVDVTPSDTANPEPTQITISGNASANGGPAGGAVPQPAVNVVDFGITAAPPTQTIAAGDTATFQIVFTPTTQYGYNASISPSETSSPSLVTSPSPTFNPSSVTLSGTGQGTTTLTIATVPRPVTTGSLFRRGSLYAAWLPIGGLSLIGLGIGAGSKRRRWLAGAVLGLIAGMILLLPSCGSASTSANTPGGTQAGTYIITITGSAGTGASHTYAVHLVVN